MDEARLRLIGYEVVAREADTDDSFKRVSPRTYDLEEAARDFRTLWLKAHPTHEVLVRQVVKAKRSA